jgi:hypothetical protein
MNLAQLNLDLYNIPDDNNIQIPVALIAADLKTKKLINGLTSIGCDNCFCVSDLFVLVFAFVGFDDYPDSLTDFYFQLLDQYCDSVSHDNDMPAKEAFIIYQQLVRKKNENSNARP